MEFEIPKPSSFLSDLDVPQVTMVGAGPSDIHPRVMNAMSSPANHEKTVQILNEIKEGVQYVFQTTYNHIMVMPLLGDGDMEAAIHAICNLAAPEEKVAIAIKGIWPKRAEDIGINVIRTEKTSGDVFTLDDIKQTLEDHKPVLLYMVLRESSTVQPMKGIGELCHEHNCLLVLDCVADVAVVPVFTDKWGVDVVIGSSEGGLKCPPGLAPMAFSPRAVEKMSRQSPVPAHAINLVNLLKTWGCLDGKMTFDPQPFHLYSALREGLAVVVKEGLENVCERHRTS